VSSIQTLAPWDRTADGTRKRRCVSAVFICCLLTAVALSAQTFTSLLSFNGINGNWPNSQLVQGLDGNLYGTTFEGGKFKSTCSPEGCGTVFKIPPNGVLTTVYACCSQTNCADGILPVGLVLGTDGNFYGTTES